MIKYLTILGVAAALYTAAPQAEAEAAWKQPGCKRVTVELSGVVEAVWTGCKLKWWGAKFVPGINPEGDVTESPLSPGKPGCPPPPPCYTAKKYTRV